MVDQREQVRGPIRPVEDSSHRSTKPLGVTVNVTAAVASMIAVIAHEENKSEAQVIRDAITVVVNAPRQPRDRDAEFKEKLAAASRGEIKKKSREGQLTNRLSTYLDSDLHSALIAYSREERVSKARAMRNAIDNHVWEAVRKVGLGDLPEVADLANTGSGGRRK